MSNDIRKAIKKRLGLIVVVTVVLAGWVILSRSRSLEPSPPMPEPRPAIAAVTRAARSATVTEPLQLSYGRLAARAQSGDKIAADALFQNLATCQTYVQVRRMFHVDTYDAWLSSVKAFMATLPPERQQAMRNRARNRYEFLEQTQGLCDQLDTSFDDGRIYDATMIAASNGNEQATACLLDAPWTNPNLSPEDAVAFDTKRFDLADGQVANGSSLAVSALKNVYSAMGSSRPFSGIDHANRYDFLRYSYLEQLGWESTGTLDPANSHDIALAEDQVTADERTRASKWARDTYNAYFKKRANQPYADHFEPCSTLPTF